MFSASAEFYDLIYSTFKDYEAESTQIASLLHRLNPHCHTVSPERVVRKRARRMAFASRA